MRKRLVLLTALVAGSSFAQEAELGVVGGFGGVGTDDNAGGGFGMFGAEVCGFASSRFALFGEYSHWARAGGNGAIQQVDLAGGGLRVQGRGRIRPFFDIGAGGGQDRFTRSYANAPSEGQSHNLGGLILGGGVAINVGERWYLRPQFRTFVLSGMHVAAAGAVGVGYRF